MVRHTATRAPPCADIGKPWLEVENQARAENATHRTLAGNRSANMAMITNPRPFGKPYGSKNQSGCPECGRKNCPCFAAGSCATYKKVNRNLSEKFGVTCPNTGYPSADFERLIDLIRLRLPGRGR